MIQTNKTLSLVLGSFIKDSQGGAELQAYYLGLAALQRKWNTHYCFLSNEHNLDNQSKILLHPIKRKRIWTKLGNIKYPYAFDLTGRLKDVKPDVIYQRGGLSFTGIAASYAKKHNCRFVFHIAHDKDVLPCSIPWNKPYLIPELKLMQHGINNADVIISQTKFQAKQLYENYGKSSVVIPNGHPVPANCQKDMNKRTILWIANWKLLKQPEIFVKLAGKFTQKDNIRFIMLGRTHNYNNLVSQAQNNKIEVMGEIPHDQVNKLLREAHILVNTSKQEGFSNTFIQAWMRCVPVVSLTVDPDNIIRRNNIGYCSGNFEELIKDIQKLIIDNEKLEKMGIKARKYAIDHFSMDNIEKTLDMLQL